MQPLFAVLYDRILAQRLLRWVKINKEQTAFQKGKGTIDQIFVLRMLIGLIKVNKLPLYVGFFDLSKAFDRVSRFLLLKALVKMGIGCVMLKTLKCIYSNTRCILKGFGKLSQVFETYTGIKQGASSSVILFIAFLDDIIDILKEKCAPERVLDNLHCLLHADDTLVLSTNRDAFIKKCNILIETIQNKRMSLNYKKSAYMIINQSSDDKRCDLKLEKGWLQYSKCHKYLGVIISHSGSLKDDINEFVKDKNKDVSVKLTNFIRKNTYAPICVKLNVVKACVNSSLTYGCETWSSSCFNNIEVLQRTALKIALNIKKNTSNEILYIESGFKPLKASIYKRQLKFYRKFKSDCASDPLSSISKLFTQALEKNISFLRHYKKLDNNFTTPYDCSRYYNQESDAIFTTKILQSATDMDNILGTYYRINPELKSPGFYQKPSCIEINRKIITQYRTGSHNLRIHKGRANNEERANRLCSCGIASQTVEHMLFNCPNTENVRRIHTYGHLNLRSFFSILNLDKMSDILKSVDSLK